MQKQKTKPAKNPETGNLLNSKIEKLEISEGELRDFIDSSIANIEGKLIPSPSPDNQSLMLFDMSKLEKKRKTDFALTKNIMMERNLIEIPIAVYSNKIKKNWVEFKRKDTETKVGTPDGALTGFDERIFWGVVGYRSKLYIKNDKVYYVSYFTTYDVMKDLILSSGGRIRKIINNSINKLGNMIINYKNFKVSHGKNSEKKIVEFIDRIPMFKYSGTRTIKEGSFEKNYHLFIWNDPFSYNIVNEYVKYISKQRFTEIRDDLARRVWIYLSCKIGVKSYYSENVYSVLNTTGISTVNTNKTKAINTLKDKLDFLVEKKDFGIYKIKDEILTIYPTKKYPELSNRILDWLYMDIFNNWIKTPKPKMINKINTLIKNYGDAKIEEIFLSAQHRADPHPRHFIEGIKQLEAEEAPVTERLTHKEIHKLKEKAGFK